MGYSLWEWLGSAVVVSAFLAIAWMIYYTVRHWNDPWEGF